MAMITSAVHRVNQTLLTLSTWMLGVHIVATPLFGMRADRYGYKPALQFGLLAQTMAMILSLIVTLLMTSV